jgi:catechol 2,3-dioxygenase-like lactoylglutathione lyase family enzyme
MIGEHERERFDTGREGARSSAQASEGATSTLERNWSTLPPVQRAQRGIEIKALNHFAINVSDLARAEAFYQEFLSLDIVGRGQLVNGQWEALGPGYSWSDASSAGQTADISFLRNGPLVLALRRVGLGARLERSAVDHISLRVDSASFRAIKGSALLRGTEVIAEEPGSITLRDPFMVTWEIGLLSLPEFLA